MNEISFSPSAIAAATAAALTVTTTEQTVFEITDPKFLQKTQLTAYFDAALGTLTSMKVRYYVADGKTSGGVLVYYQIPVKDLATGVLIDRPSVLDSSSPAQTGTIRVQEDVPVPACLALKITIIGAGGVSGTLNECRALVRDN